MTPAKKEVLRYLGYGHQALSPFLEEMLDTAMRELREMTVPRQVTARFRMAQGRLSPGGEGSAADAQGILLKGTSLSLKGNEVARHLAGCSEVVLMAMTLGVAADHLIRRWEKRDLTRAVVLDACATQLVEEHCDGWETRLRQEEAREGRQVTGRFSPGYGDLPLEIQPDFLRLLQAESRIGLTCTPALLMLPQKSVTALVGIGREISAGARPCELCGLRTHCDGKKACGGEKADGIGLV